MQQSVGVLLPRFSGSIRCSEGNRTSGAVKGLRQRLTTFVSRGFAVLGRASRDIRPLLAPSVPHAHAAGASLKAR